MPKDFTGSVGTSFFIILQKKLDFFNKTAYLGYLSTLLSPAIYGLFLSLFKEKGYLFLFFLTSVILSVAMLMAENVNASGAFSLNESFTVIAKNEEYRYTMISLSLVSGYNYIVSNLIPIILYRIVNKNYFYFSILNYILGLLSILSIYFIRGRMLKENKVNPSFIVSFSVLAYQAFPSSSIP